MNYEQEFQHYAELVKQGIFQMTDPIQAFTAARNAFDIVKNLSAYGEEIKDLAKRGEYMRMIGELSVELGETKIKLAEKIRENSELIEKLNAWETAKDLILTPKRSGYYKENDDGPFCTGCYDNNRKLIRLKETGGVMPIYMCPVCNTESSFFDG
jgi:hypothetical protein